MLHQRMNKTMWHEISRHLPIVAVCVVGAVTMWLNNQSIPPEKYFYPPVNVSPLRSPDEIRSPERKIADHFLNDTLPGLLQLGLIQKYQREASGTRISVNGGLWKKRSLFFKQCLLAEVMVYNKVNGYVVSTRIEDSTSGKLYAQLSSAEKIDFYD